MRDREKPVDKNEKREKPIDRYLLTSMGDRERPVGRFLLAELNEEEELLSTGRERGKGLSAE